MVLGFVAFLVLFDTGLTWATVQSPRLNKDTVDSLFAAGILLGLTLWLGSALAAPALAHFYDQPQLIAATVVMGGAVFLNSLTTQPAALLKRQLRQRATNGVDTAALVVSSALAVGLALAGFKYWALIAQAVSMQAARTALLFSYSGYRPSMPRSLKPAMRELRLGGTLALSNYVGYFQLYLGGIIVGHYFGGALLGNYQRAYGVKSMPTTYGTMLVTDVMVSSLAALYSDKQRFGEAYLKALRLTAFVGCPAGAALLPLSGEIIWILFGPRWTGVPPLLEWYTLAAVALPITTSTIWLFLASGNARQQLRMNVFLTAISIFFMLGAAYYGRSVASIVAMESILFAGPYLLVNLVMSHRAVGLPLAPTIRVIAPLVAGSLVSAGLAWLVGQSMQDIDWRLTFGAKLMVGGISYLAFCAVFADKLPLNITVFRR